MILLSKGYKRHLRPIVSLVKSQGRQCRVMDPLSSVPENAIGANQ